MNFPILQIHKENNVYATSTKIIQLLEEIYLGLKQVAPELIDHGPAQFHSTQKKNVPYFNYFKRTKLILTMKRLSRHISTNVIVCGLIYVDRLSCKNNFFLTRKNSFKLMVVALLISEKFLSDKHIPTEIFCKFSRLSRLEIVELEKQFLKLINYNLFISEEDFQRQLKNLNNQKESSISSDDFYDQLETDSE